MTGKLYNEFSYLGNIDISLCEEGLVQDDVDWIMHEVQQFQAKLEMYSECISVSIDFDPEYGIK